jgi:hypothetical protein
MWGGTHKYLECKPGITNTFYVEKGNMCCGVLLVKRPGRRLVGRPDRNVPNVRHPHIRMRLQAKRYDGHTDEEDRYYADDLRTEEEEGQMKMDENIANQLIIKSLFCIYSQYYSHFFALMFPISSMDKINFYCF